MSETTELDELSVEARRVIEELRLDKIEIFCRYFLAVHAKVPGDFDSVVETIQLAESIYDLVDGDRETKELGVDVYILLVGVLRARKELGSLFATTFHAIHQDFPGAQVGRNPRAVPKGCGTHVTLSPPLSPVV